MIVTGMWFYRTTRRNMGVKFKTEKDEVYD